MAAIAGISMPSNSYITTIARRRGASLPSARLTVTRATTALSGVDPGDVADECSGSARFSTACLRQ
jgi:hypothetical protein